MINWNEPIEIWSDKLKAFVPADMVARINNIYVVKSKEKVPLDFPDVDGCLWITCRPCGTGLQKLITSCDRFDNIYSLAYVRNKREEEKHINT